MAKVKNAVLLSIIPLPPAGKQLTTFSSLAIRLVSYRSFKQCGHIAVLKSLNLLQIIKNIISQKGALKSTPDS